jgi:hypothetical protein
MFLINDNKQSSNDESLPLLCEWCYKRDTREGGWGYPIAIKTLLSCTIFCLKKCGSKSKLRLCSTYVLVYKIECEVCSKLALLCKLVVLYCIRKNQLSPLDYFAIWVAFICFILVAYKLDLPTLCRYKNLYYVPTILRKWQHVLCLHTSIWA